MPSQSSHSPIFFSSLCALCEEDDANDDMVPYTDALDALSSPAGSSGSSGANGAFAGAAREAMRVLEARGGSTAAYNSAARNFLSIF